MTSSDVDGAAALEAATAPPGASLMVDDVYDTLLSAIDEGRLPAGTPLSQNKLAAHLGVSRTPVREALLRLERDGLVRRVPDMGFAVSMITPAEVHDACDLLEVLDTYVYVRAARALSPQAVAELHELAANLVSSAGSDDIAAWKTADQRYHAIVMEAAGNRLLAEHLQQVRRRVHRFGLRETGGTGRLAPCAQDHLTLAQALSEGDEARLAATVTEHIARLRRSIIDRLEIVAPLLPSQNPLTAAALTD